MGWNRRPLRVAVFAALLLVLAGYRGWRVYYRQWPEPRSAAATLPLATSPLGDADQ